MSKFLSPGVKINEIDMSIVPPITPPNVTQLFFINSNWGKEGLTLVEGGSQEFQKKFGFPSIPDEKPLQWLSWDAQYKFSQFGKVLVQKRNPGGDKQSSDFIDQKYNGEYGNYLKTEIQTVKDSDDSYSVNLNVIDTDDNKVIEELSQSFDFQYETKEFLNTDTTTTGTIRVTDGTDILDVPTVQESVQISLDTGNIILTDDGLGKISIDTGYDLTVDYKNLTIEFPTFETSQIVSFNGTDYNTMSDLFTDFIQLIDSITVSEIIENNVSELIDLFNENSEFIDLTSQLETNNTFVDVFNPNLELVEYTLTGGTTGSQNSQSVDSFLSDLENIYQYKFSMCQTQGNLTQSEVNSLQTIQNKRKDFIILTEFVDVDNGDLVYPNYKAIQKKPDDYQNLFSTNIVGSYIQVYHPYTIQLTQDGKRVEYPASYSQLLNVYDRLLTDTPWLAQAGLTRGGVVGDVSFILNTQMQDRLYNARVNPLVKFQGQGNYVWGQKTTYQANSQLNRINQRLTQMKAEIEIWNRMRTYLFEPYTDATIQQIETSIDSVLQDIQNRGGFYGYSVQIDQRDEYIDEGYLMQNISIQPTKQLEYINLTFVVKNYQSQL